MPASTPRAQRSLNPATIASAMKKCVPAAPSGIFERHETALQQDVDDRARERAQQRAQRTGGDKRPEAGLGVGEQRVQAQVARGHPVQDAEQRAHATRDQAGQEHARLILSVGQHREAEREQEADAGDHRQPADHARQVAGLGAALGGAPEVSLGTIERGLEVVDPRALDGAPSARAAAFGRAP